MLFSNVILSGGILKIEPIKSVMLAGIFMWKIDARGLLKNAVDGGIYRLQLIVAF